jgi:hypothetical protein
LRSSTVGETGSSSSPSRGEREGKAEEATGATGAYGLRSDDGIEGSGEAKKSNTNGGGSGLLYDVVDEMKVP